jgi:hypothetical protein
MQCARMRLSVLFCSVVHRNRSARGDFKLPHAAEPAVARQ